MSRPANELARVAAYDLGVEDARSGREPLWYRVGESYLVGDLIGPAHLGEAYVAGYTTARNAMADEHAPLLFAGCVVSCPHTVVKTYLSDGSDGYSPGTYGVTVSGVYADGTTWASGDGGWPTAKLAERRGQQIASALAVTNDGGAS